MSDGRIAVLFVCLGNICRSPLAEGVFRKLVNDTGLSERFDIDSAGTSGYHDGEGPDPRTVKVARRRGVIVDGISRRIQKQDFQRFHYILAMDSDNLRQVRKLAASVRANAEIRLLREFDAHANGVIDVPDPWYGGESAFEEVQDIIERSCRAFLDHLITAHGLR